MPLSVWLTKVTPLVLLVSVGTALLRHDAKLRLRYEHLSNKKHSLEKAAGVLDASIKLSGVSNIQELHPMVSETFSRVSAYLLVEADGLDGQSDDDKSSEYQALLTAIARGSAAAANR